MLLGDLEIPDSTALEIAMRLRERRHHDTAFRIERASYAGKRTCRLSREELDDAFEALCEHGAPARGARFARPADPTPTLRSRGRGADRAGPLPR
jgi:hypothetical protein